MDVGLNGARTSGLRSATSMGSALACAVCEFDGVRQKLAAARDCACREFDNYHDARQPASLSQNPCDHR